MALIDRSRPLAPLAGARVVVVEDEAVLAEALSITLARLGLIVVAMADTADQAIAAVEREQPTLVLMDIRLKGARDGIEAASEIRARFGVPVVFLTAHADETTLRRARDSEPFGCVLKPASESELRATIDIALQRHQLEHRLRESERRWATTLASIGDAVIATDTEGLVTFLNPVAEALTRWTLDEARGQPLANVFHLVDAATRTPCESPIARALRENHVVTIAERSLLVAKDGSEVSIDDSAAPIRDGEDRAVGGVLVFRDVGERQQAADRLHAAEEQLRQAQKMEAIGRLAGGVAHDVNNMMAVVIGYAEMLLANFGAADERSAMVAEIREAADRSASMTRQLLAFSRRQVLNPVPTGLGQIVVSAGPMLDRLAGPAVTLEIECLDQVGSVLVDRVQIEQVLVNLVANARDAMPTGGRIRIVVKDVTLDAAQAQPLPDVLPGEYVQLSISDTGIGMDADTATHVFEPFYTTKAMGRGAGLGLATVYGIVRQSNGFVAVESRVGVGTTFTIYLPRIAADNRRVSSAGSSKGN